ncbi:MAG: carbonic anhydrase, partial [Selenomonadaceae bacterium]|nr:carbonic anhydrase [Selenomonadaceae bacterium]
TQEDHQKSKLPQKQVAIITCMDTRLVNFLEPALGLARGDAKVIKTAGNSVTGVFDGTIRSLMVCIYELGVKEILVIGHHECGMAKTTSQSLTNAMLSRGVPKEAIHMVAKELREWADEFHHPEQNVRDTVEAIRLNPLIPSDVPTHGLIFHPRTGKLDVIIDGYEYAEQQ